jgi:8-oxo-dGTP pyrophosphatase MutT (NUDIX family)
MSVKLRGCGVYVFNDDGTRVLLTQRGPAARNEHFKWEGPGGQLEPDESYEQAAERELLEELGIRVELTGILGEYDEIIAGGGKLWEAKIFRALTEDIPVIQEPGKCIGFGWFGREEVIAFHEAGALASYAAKDFQHIGWL